MKLKLSVLILILAATFLAYSNSLRNPFIWDDEALVVKNTLIRDWRLWPYAFTSDLYYGVSSGSNFYRPAQTLTYMLDYHFWELDPAGYHISNILLQALVAFLIFLLLLEASLAIEVALAAALFFSCSPLHSETVTYISGRAELLLGFFLLGCLWLFIRAQRATGGLRRSALALSWLAYALALLSKELAIVFPLVILAYLFYLKAEGPKRIIKESLPYFIIAAIYIFLRLFLFSFQTIRPPALASIPFFIRLTVLPKVIFTYLKLLVLPVGLHMSRQLLRPLGPAGIAISLGALCLLACSCFFYLRYGRRNPAAAFLLFWSVAFFIPQSGILPINSFVAEHFIYLSSIPFFILAAFLLRKYLRKRTFILCSGGLIIFYALLTLGRNYEWANPVIFYEKIIRFSPDSFQAHNNLGLQYERRGLYAQALVEYKRALAIKPDLIEARSNLANLYFKLKEYGQAKNEYLIAEKMSSGAKAGEVQNNIGNIYEVEGSEDKAIERYGLALRLDPSLTFTHFNLARIYARKKDIPLAAREILNSLSTNTPEQEELYLNLILSYLKGSPSFGSAEEFYNNLGVEFARHSLWQPATASFAMAIELDPDFCDAYFNLGLAYFKNGQKREAASSLKRCLRINPNHLKAKGLLSIICKK